MELIVMSHPAPDYPIEHSVFYCRKALDNATILIVRADLQPIPEEHRCGYRFMIALTLGDETEIEELPDVTSDQKIAEELFDLLVSFNASPCHLRDIAEDFLVSEYTIA